MNTILEDVFLHDDVRGGQAVGFITAGPYKAPGLTIGYIVSHDLLGASYVAYACHPPAFLQAYHLRTIAHRLQHLNERQEKE